MNNVLRLQKQYSKPMRIYMIVTDALMCFLLAVLAVMSIVEHMAWRDLQDVLAVFLVCGLIIAAVNVLVLAGSSRLHASLSGLPLDQQAAIDRQCMTGLRFGNGILCENGCLLVLGRTAKAVLPENIRVINRQKLGLGESITVTDHLGGLHRIAGPVKAVKGDGTFREADMETFYQELNRAASGEYVTSEDMESLQGKIDRDILESSKEYRRRLYEDAPEAAAFARKRRVLMYVLLGTACLHFGFAILLLFVSPGRQESGQAVAVFQEVIRLLVHLFIIGVAMSRPFRWKRELLLCCTAVPSLISVLLNYAVIVESVKSVLEYSSFVPTAAVVGVVGYAVLNYVYVFELLFVLLWLVLPAKNRELADEAGAIEMEWNRDIISRTQERRGG